VKNKVAFLVASKETGLEVNADKTKYMVISRDQTAGRSHNIKIDKKIIRKGGTVQMLGNNLNKSKFYSGRN
jgi:ABC-type branched-subunit amino acid transport system substrate-binding protein